MSMVIISSSNVVASGVKSAPSGVRVQIEQGTVQTRRKLKETAEKVRARPRLPAAEEDGGAPPRANRALSLHNTTSVRGSVKHRARAQHFPGEAVCSAFLVAEEEGCAWADRRFLRRSAPGRRRTKKCCSARCHESSPPRPGGDRREHSGTPTESALLRKCQHCNVCYISVISPSPRKLCELLPRGLVSLEKEYFNLSAF